MAGAEMFEATCPSCYKAFDVPEDATDGRCPNCDRVMRFLDEPSLQVTEPRAADEQAPSEAEGAQPTADAIEAPECSPPGHWRVECPACHHPFDVDPHDNAAACPACDASLLIEPVEDPVLALQTVCPQCRARLSVASDARTAQCNSCGARLRLEDVWPEDVPSAVAAAEPPEPAVEAAEQDTAPKQSPPASAPAPPKGPIAEPPPAQGIPHPVSCPNCAKEFGVLPGTSEGNCPHCKFSVAFITAREADQLKKAEERRQAFVAKQAERAQKRQAQEEARRIAAKEAAATTTATEGEAMVAFQEEPKQPLLRKLPGLRRGAKPKRDEAEDGAAEADVDGVIDVETEVNLDVAPEPPAEKPATFDVETHIDLDPAPAPVELEDVAIEVELDEQPPATKPRGVMEATVAPPQQEIVDFEVDAVDAAPEPIKRPSKRRRAISSEPAPEDVEMSVELEAALDTDAVVDLQIDEIEVPPEAPTRKKRRGRKHEAPLEFDAVELEMSAEADVAAVEANFEIDEEPQPSARPRGRKKAADVPIAIDLELDVESTADVAQEVEVQFDDPAQDLELDADVEADVPTEVEIEIDEPTVEADAAVDEVQIDLDLDNGGEIQLDSEPEVEFELDIEEPAKSKKSKRRPATLDEDIEIDLDL